MRRNFHPIALAAIITALGATVTPAHAGQVSGAAQARIRPAIAVTNSRPLDFGVIVRGTTAGTVTINALTGVRTRTGGAVIGNATASTAAFSATAAAGAIVTVRTQATQILLSNVNGATMRVNTFRLSTAGGAQQTMPRTLTMPASGSQSFTLGGRLNLAANQAVGNYSGTVVLMIDYQ